MKTQNVIAGLAIAAAIGGLASCATTPREERVDEKAAEFLAGFDRTGEIDACVPITRVQQIRPVSESVFLVRTGVNQWRVSDMKGRCTNATRVQKRLEYNLQATQLCRNEIVRIVDNLTGAVQGACSFGDFERLTPKADEE